MDVANNRSVWHVWGTEVPHVESEPVSNSSITGRSRGAVPPSGEVYVTVLSGCSRQDDPPRCPRLEQRRDRGEPAHPPRNREPVAQALLRAAIARAGGSGSPRPAPGFPPQTWSCRSRLWPVSCQQHTACRCRASVSRTWRDSLDSRAWLPPSAIAPYGAGSTRMRSDPGSTAAGSFPVMLSSRLKRDASSICTNGAGTARHCATMSSWCLPTRRPASRRAFVAIQACRPNPPRPCALSMNTSAAERGRTWPRSMCIAPRCLAAVRPRMASPRSTDWSRRSCGNRRTTRLAGSSGLWTIAPRIGAADASRDSKHNFHDSLRSMVPFMRVGSIRSRSTSLSCNVRCLPPTTSHHWPPLSNDCWVSKPTSNPSHGPSSGNSLVAISPHYSARSDPPPIHYLVSQRDPRIRVRTYEPEYLAKLS